MIDSHSHIYTEPYAQDRAEVIQRAAQAGIQQLLQVGCNLQDSMDALALAEAHQGIYATVGVHPHDASDWNDEVCAGLEALLSNDKVVGWGEIGLDFYYDTSPRDAQMIAFAAQMDRARAHDLPVVIHTRDAEPETLAVMEDYLMPRGGHVHCFTGTGEMAEALLARGYHIGFTGIITFRNADALREVVARVPLERLLIETDSPYLAPIPHRGKRNEPAFVAHVAQAVADIKQVNLEQLLAVTDANFRELYGTSKRVWQELAP